jgi:ABC-type cobalamin/Fe3+-siderophores transport system ATPase subunit
MINETYIGAEWIRVDLHLHSPGIDSFSLPPGINLSSEEDKRRIIKTYVEKLKQTSIKIAAITDYNGIREDWFIPIKEEAKNEGIIILPGAELDISLTGGKYGLHLIVVLNEAIDIHGFNTFLHSLDKNPQENLVTGRFHREINSKYELEELVNEIRKKFDCLIIFVHPEDDKGLFKTFSPNISAKYLSTIKPDAIEFYPDKWKNKLESTAEISLDDLNKIAIIENSDPKSIDEIGNKKRNGKIRATYLKLSDLSLSAIKLALHDPEVRVKLYEKPEMFNTRISSIYINGTTFLKNISINFNPELNTFIGGRGVGKSAIIESIRYCLNLPVYTESTQKDEFVSNVVGSGGEIILEVDKYQGQKKLSYKIKRILNKLPEVYDEFGNKIETEPDKILDEKTPILIGQKELYEISQDDRFLLHLIDQLIGEKIKEKQKEFNDWINKLKENGRKILDLEKKLDKKNEYEQELKTLNAKIQDYEKLGVAEKLSNYAKIIEDDEKIHFADEKIKRLIDEIENTLNQSKEEIDGIYYSLKNASSEKKEILTELANIFENIGNLIRGIQLVRELRKIYETEIKKIIQTWNIEKEKEEMGIQEIKKKLGEEELEPEKFEHYTRRKTQLESLLKDFKKYEEQLNKLKEERKRLKDEVKNSRYALYNTRFKEIEEINKKLKGKVKINVIYEGEKKLFKRQLENLLKGSGLHSNAIDSLVNSKDLTIDGILLSDLIAKGKNELIKAFNLTEKMAERIIEYLKDKNKLFELETIFPDDQIIIELNVDEKYYPLDKLSPGQRATALLLLLFIMEDRILILDQPEEDLDNRFIYEDVVKELRALKGKRQIIIATHNANIPVIGDSELIIVLDKQEGICKIVDKGSVDKEIIKEHVKRIMEGGEEAFRRRAEKYGRI